ncbi:ACP S-malonyltransferase [Ramlibacter albus]|uniref:Acyltransferase domain-containing protein n=1 Tax=Ramlibacter albus TaxID=2079448 RepID=A0A923MC89_9BURK|nr:acyltransferase domain-containing protein [Ramlibacter albus]MBC5766397.1 acyltransferase domain-containing protein [Ramlibacter albus]
MSLAVLFPGQGNQREAMLPWLESQPVAAGVLASMGEAIGLDWRDRLADPGWASANRIAQPLLTGTSLAAWRCLAGLLPEPGVIAGYSVGELAAFAAAGAFDPEVAVPLSVTRAACMDAAGEGALLAVHGVNPGQRAAIAQRHGLALAIDACSETAIFGARKPAVDAAEAALTAHGVRTTRLAVEVASHTPLMSDAASAFAIRLARLDFTAPKAPIACNLTGAATRDPAELKRCLALQIASPVQWRTCMQTLAERGVTCALEIGPGAALSKMLMAEHPHIQARSVDEFRTPQGCAAWVHRALADR